MLKGREKKPPGQFPSPNQKELETREAFGLRRFPALSFYLASLAQKATENGAVQTLRLCGLSGSSVALNLSRRTVRTIQSEPNARRKDGRHCVVTHHSVDNLLVIRPRLTLGKIRVN